MEKACLRGYSDVSLFLIMQGSDLYNFMEDGTSILHRAVLKRHLEIDLDTKLNFDIKKESRTTGGKIPFIR